MNSKQEKLDDLDSTLETDEKKCFISKKKGYMNK